MNESGPTNPGELLRHWRQRRRLSQFALAIDTGVSQRHLSFVESGRSTPSRAMILMLAEQLSIPLREQNTILLSAGFAPSYGERRFNDAGFDAARRVIDLILSGHEPYPALVVDRHWIMLAANKSVALLLAGTDPALLEPPVNVLRLSLHPQGLAPRIVNYHEWRAHVLARLGHQLENSADPLIAELIDELGGYPIPPGARPPEPSRQAEFAGLAVPLELATDAGTLSFVSTTTMFGTPTEITLSELVIESFFPADAATASAMQALGASVQS